MARLTVGYEATAAFQQTAGIGRYVRELLCALSRLESSDYYRVTYMGHALQSVDLGERFKLFRVPVTDRVMNVLWQRARIPLPIELRTGRLDVFHSPDFSLPPSLAPSIVTIHDLAFEALPQVCYPTLAKYLHRVVPRVIDRSTAVIAPSNFTKGELIEHFAVPAPKIHVIPEAVSPIFTPAPAPPDEMFLTRFDIERPFALAVSTLEPRKNLERLLTAFAALRSRGRDISLVIVGRPGWLYDSIFQACRDLRLETCVHFLSSVDDEQLAGLYRRAEFAVYPSMYEGFGLPPLEALSCGCPLACSGNSSLPEVVGHAAEFFDPWDVEDITETLDLLTLDSDRRSRLKDAGPKQSANFSWDKAARETHDLYQHVATA